MASFESFSSKAPSSLAGPCDASSCSTQTSLRTTDAAGHARLCRRQKVSVGVAVDTRVAVQHCTAGTNRQQRSQGGIGCVGSVMSERVWHGTRVHPEIQCLLVLCDASANHFRKCISPRVMGHTLRSLSAQQRGVGSLRCLFHRSSLVLSGI